MTQSFMRGFFFKTTRLSPPPPLFSSAVETGQSHFEPSSIKLGGGGGEGEKELNEKKEGRGCGGYSSLQLSPKAVFKIWQSKWNNCRTYASKYLLGLNLQGLLI